MLPILHLNGYKIANPTLFARISHEELEDFFRGCGWEPHFVEGSAPAEMHRLMADTLDECIEKILAYQKDARENGNMNRPRWPMIVFRSPKGWTGPAYVDGLKVENYVARAPGAHSARLPTRAYPHRSSSGYIPIIPKSCSTRTALPCRSCSTSRPRGTRRMGANPHANGGLLLKRSAHARLPRRTSVPVPGARQPSRRRT